MTRRAHQAVLYLLLAIAVLGLASMACTVDMDRSGWERQTEATLRVNGQTLYPHDLVTPTPAQQGVGGGAE